MASMTGSNVVSPPGTRLGPRHNIAPTERALSVAAGAIVGLVAVKRGGPTGAMLAALSGALVVRGTTGAAPLRRSFGPGPDDLAAAKREGWSSAAVAARAVTINAPRHEVYDYVRKFSNLPKFMVNLDSVVETSPTQSHWTVIGPGGRKVEWDAVVREVPGEKIEWVSVPGAAVPNRGTIEFRDATGGRGTEVHATITYRPVGGTIGKLVAKLTQKEPGIQVRRDLKRLKMIFEAGEISTNAPQGSPPKA